MYKAIKTITGDNLILRNTTDLTVDDLGGKESVERLVRVGAIEEMPTGKKKAEPEAEITEPKGKAKITEPKEK